MSDPEMITEDILNQELYALCESNPDKRNPAVKDNIGGCFYTSPNDPDDHCLLAQWGVTRGLKIPGPDEGKTIGDVALDYEWPLSLDARWAAEYWQATADLCDDDEEYIPPTWGEVATRVKERGGPPGPLRKHLKATS